MTTDPFAVLGVSPDATLDEVRAARRKLAAEFHPDHGGDPVRMGEINIAFDAAIAQIAIRRVPAPLAPPPSAAPPASAQPSAGRRYPGVQHDAPSFTIDTLPVDAFEALLIVTSWMGEVLVDDPPYLLEVHLTEPSPCWCRLDLVPDAGSSTVTLTVASIDGAPAPDIEAVRDLWVANLNRL
ncbi:MAG: J domain-containing protein [Ilumatobacteraceae bacterium]|nr:J domain-containing protein [Ilumatobacteraceae bacterium]